MASSNEIVENSPTITLSMQRLRQEIHTCQEKLKEGSLYPYVRNNVEKEMERKEEAEALLFYEELDNTVIYPYHNPKIQRIGYCLANLQPEEVPKEDKFCIPSWLNGWQDMLYQIFNIHNGNTISATYKTLCNFHDIAKAFTSTKLESVKWTSTKNKTNGKHLHRFWSKQFIALQEQKTKLIDDIVEGDDLSQEERKRMEQYIVEDSEDCFIVEACNTMKHMLDSVILSIRIRSIGEIYERIIDEVYESRNADDEISDIIKE